MLMEAMLSESVDGNGAPYPGGCNYGLIREEMAALVGVSDEPEQVSTVIPTTSQCSKHKIKPK